MAEKKLCPPLLHHYFCFSEPHHVLLLWRASHLQPSFSHHLSSTITPALISLSAVDWLTSSWEKQWVLMGSPYLTFFTTHLFLVVSHQACTTVYSKCMCEGLCRIRSFDSDNKLKGYRWWHTGSICIFYWWSICVITCSHCQEKENSSFIKKLFHLAPGDNKLLLFLDHRQYGSQFDIENW